jgi:lysozyme
VGKEALEEAEDVNAVDLALPRLKTEEGFRATKYTDTRGHLTIGYGFDVDAGISQYAASALLTAQATERHESLAVYAWYAGLDPVRQSVCLDIAFNGGLHGLLEFPHMIAALAKGDWVTAAAECKVTNPELAGRYAALAQLLLTG